MFAEMETKTLPFSAKAGADSGLGFGYLDATEEKVAFLICLSCQEYLSVTFDM